jgi:hypothetical protein
MIACVDDEEYILYVYEIRRLVGHYKYCRIWGFHSGGYKEYHLLGYDAV